MAIVRTVNGGRVEVQVWVDWQEAVREPIGRELLEGIEGPPGIRTDNGRYDFRYFVGSLED